MGLAMLKGTTAHPSLVSLERARADLYGTKLSVNLRDGIGTRTLSFTCIFPEDRYISDENQLLEKAAEHIAEVVFTPALTQKIIRKEKRDLIIRLLGELNNPQAVVMRDYYKLLFKDELFFNEVKTLLKDARKVTRKKVLAYYDDFIANARAEVFYCGSSPKERVEAASAKLFERRTLKTVVKTMPQMEQSTLVLTFRFNPNAASPLAFRTFDALFGQIPSSKLFKNLRERQNLCYSVASNTDTNNGIMLVICGIDAGKREAAKAEILAQLEAAKRGELEELDAAKLSLPGADKNRIGQYNELGAVPL
jgi:predicted Zn-dependent peptidase